MDKTNKIHWVSREELMKPKVDGGLGFRNLHFFNLAMLARQALRILQNPHSLCSQVLAARYILPQWLNARSHTSSRYLLHMAQHTKRDATAEKRDYMASGQW